MAVANRQWFVDQGTPVIESVPYGADEVRVRSLDVLERSIASAKASQASMVNGELDAAQFAVENAISLLAASIVDETGKRIFGDTAEDYAIIKKLRSKIGDAIDSKVQSLSFADQDNKLKNLPPVTVSGS